MLGIERRDSHHPYITPLPEVITPPKLITTSQIQAEQVLKIFSENYRDSPLTPRSNAVVQDYLTAFLVFTNRRQAILIKGSTIEPVRRFKNDIREAIRFHEMVSRFGSQKPLDLEHAEAHHIIARTVARTLLRCYGDPGDLTGSAQEQLSDFIKRLGEIEQEAQALQPTTT